MNSGMKSLLSPRGINKTPQSKKQSLVPSFRTPLWVNKSFFLCTQCDGKGYLFSSLLILQLKSKLLAYS